ncbi:ABC transporter permease [Brucella anthropi]|uniref:ABC transporter permease n=1 Tax=Brucella anthropi TaxID=529 RepID=UPI002166BDE6|nr:ABC transporter permease [Brucella anthropi]UVV67857.1 ABC transporter permease [Brucella anthropi]
MLSRSLFDPNFTLKHYQRLVAEPGYFQVLLTTFEISGIVTVCALLLGYPLAYLLSQIRPRRAALLMIVVVVPYFTSVLVRTYAWMVILGSQGIVNQFLMWLGVIASPVSIMYSRTAVVIGMTYVMLPYMVLALYSVMRGIDTNLLLAAESLGAARTKSFWRIFLPLSMPGVAAGGLLVFILSLGFFITPALMGSQEDSMISMLVESQVETYFDWGFASTLATLLLVCTLVLFIVYERFIGLNRLFEAKL